MTKILRIVAFGSLLQTLIQFGRVHDRIKGDILK
jgi:hypothetical protein